MTAKRFGNTKRSYEGGQALTEGVPLANDAEADGFNVIAERPRQRLNSLDIKGGTNVAGVSQNLVIKPGISRDEMNLAEFPLTVLSTRATPGVKTLEFSDSVRGKNGEVINRQWIITGADKFGLPTSSDDEVLLGLLKLTVDDGIVNRKVFFTRYELLKALRWTTEGRSYSRLQKALDRLSGVRIKATNAFYDNDLKNHSTKNFGLIDEYEINNGKDSDVRPSFFVWSDVLFKSFQVGFIKKLDLDFYLNLNSAVSKRLYRYLDKHFWYKQVVKINVFTLAHEKIGVSRTYKYLSSLRQQLDPALDELIGLGFVSKYEYSGKGEGAEVSIFSGTGEARSNLPSREQIALKSEAPENLKAVKASNSGEESQERKKDFFGGGTTRALESREQATQTHTFSLTKTHQPQPTLLNEAENPSEQYRVVFQRLWGDLIRRGFNEKQVNKLLSGRARETLSRIEKIIQHCDKQLGTDSERRNPLGFLYRAIENPNQFVLPGDSVNKDDLPNSPMADNQGVKKYTPLNSSQTNKSEGRLQPQFSVTEKEAEYFSFRAREIARIKAELEDSVLDEIEGEVEAALVKLKGMISPLRYQEALNHGVDERLAKKYSIKTFQEWLNDSTPNRANLG